MSWITRCYCQFQDLTNLRSLRGKQGQELIEYALMAGFLTVSVAAFVPYTITAPLSAIFSKIMVYLHELGGA